MPNADRTMFQGRELSESELKKLRQQIVSLDDITHVSTEMRELIGERWPELLPKLPPDEEALATPADGQTPVGPGKVPASKRPFYNWSLTRGVPCVFTNTRKRPVPYGIYDEDVNLVDIISIPPRTEIEIPALENYTGKSSIVHRPLPAREKAARKRK
jgi:hypothetical protein